MLFRSFHEFPSHDNASGGKKVLMVSVSAPILVDGKVIGVAGVDFSLETINKKISEIVLFETGYLSLYETHGIVVAHPRTESIGKPFSNMTTNPTILRVVEDGVKGKDYDYKDSDTAYIRLFDVYNAQNNIDDARVYLEKAIQKNSAYTEYWTIKLIFLDEKTNVSYLDLKKIYEDGLLKVNSQTKVNLVTTLCIS